MKVVGQLDWWRLKVITSICGTMHGAYPPASSRITVTCWWRLSRWEKCRWFALRRCSLGAQDAVTQSDNVLLSPASPPTCALCRQNRYSWSVRWPPWGPRERAEQG
jgi:hypothetical protein